MRVVHELVCSACGAEALLRREPVYEDFKKVGERLTCSACGHVYASEKDVPFKQDRKPSLFTPDEAPRTVDLFKDDEKGHTCRLCDHYVVNPFTQRCGLHDRVVEATDSCSDFSPHKDGQKPQEPA